MLMTRQVFSNMRTLPLLRLNSIRSIRALSMQHRRSNLSQQWNTQPFEHTAGYFGLVNDQIKCVVYNDSITNKYHTLPLTTQTDPMMLCRVGWDLGLQSIRGYNNGMNDTEMSFELFVEDMSEESVKRELPSMIWNRLVHHGSIVN